MGAITAYSTFDLTFAGSSLHRDALAATGATIWQSAYGYSLAYVRAALRDGTANDNAEEFANAVKFMVDFATVTGIRRSDANSPANLVDLTAYSLRSTAVFLSGLTPLLLWNGNYLVVAHILDNTLPSGSYIPPVPASIIEMLSAGAIGTGPVATTVFNYCRDAYQYAVDHKLDIDPAALQAFYRLDVGLTGTPAQDWIAAKLHPASSSAVLSSPNPAMRQLLEFYLLSRGTWDPRDTGNLGGTWSPAGFPAVSLSGGAYLTAKLLLEQAAAGTPPDAYFLLKLDSINPQAAALVRYGSLRYQLDHVQNFDKAALASLADYDKANRTHYATDLLDAQSQKYLVTRNRLLNASGATTDNTLIRTATRTIRVYLDQMGSSPPPTIGSVVYVDAKAVPSGAAGTEVGHSAGLTQANIQAGYVDVAFTLPATGTFEIRSRFVDGLFVSPPSPPLSITFNSTPFALNLAGTSFSFSQTNVADGSADTTWVVNLQFTGLPITQFIKSLITAEGTFMSDGSHARRSNQGLVMVGEPIVNWQPGSQTTTIQLVFKGVLAFDVVNNPPVMDIEIRPGTAVDLDGTASPGLRFDATRSTSALSVLTAATYSPPTLPKPHFADKGALAIWDTIDPDRAAERRQQFRNCHLYAEDPPPIASVTNDDFSLSGCWAVYNPRAQACIDSLNNGLGTTSKRTDAMSRLNDFSSTFNGLQSLIGSTAAANVQLKKTLDATRGETKSQFNLFWTAYQQYFDATGNNPLTKAVTAGTFTEANPHGVLQQPDAIYFGDLTNTIGMANGHVTSMGNQSQLEMLSNQTNLQNMNSACKALSDMIESLSDVMRSIFHS